MKGMIQIMTSEQKKQFENKLSILLHFKQKYISGNCQNYSSMQCEIIQTRLGTYVDALEILGYSYNAFYYDDRVDVELVKVK